MRIVFIITFTILAFLPMKAQTLRGIASYYAHYFHGRTMANGQVFDMYQMTCAHKTLPFGTMLKVTDLDTGKSVIVEVTDRGPFKPGRIVDLSYGAAIELGIVSKGITPCEAEILNGSGMTQKDVGYFPDREFIMSSTDLKAANLFVRFIPRWVREAEKLSYRLNQ